MKKSVFLYAILAGAAVNIHASDPVVMSVNGIDVPKSEFEYLYHKNNQQQIQPQSLEDYIQLFKIYKLKVADAKSQGLDTTESFKKEMSQYRRELASPYIADSAFILSLVDETFKRTKDEVSVSFIKIAKSRNPMENNNLRHLADSLRTELINGKDFAEIAKLYSQDMAADQGGYHGYLTVGRLPYNFEEALYTTPSGKISEVVDLMDGYYILKPGDRRPSKGKVEAAHLMKLVPNNATAEERIAIKSEIDSLYRVLIENPFKFEEMARKYSDDKASARQDGKLPIFSSGEMVPEFENVAFSMADGTISEPVESKFGWHIIKKYKSYPSSEYAKVKEDILKRVNNPQDARYRVVKEKELKNLVAKHKGKIEKKNLDKLKKAAQIAGIDSMYLANWTTMPLSDTKIATIGKKNITAGEVLAPFKKMKDVDKEMAPKLLDQSVDRALGNAAFEIEQDWLYVNEPAYRNLMDEYTDGSLLYEVSLINVWDKAAKDDAGLDNYFKTHKSNYKWDKPRVKTILVQTLNDSISSLVKKELEAIGGDRNRLADVKKEFTGKALIEYVVAPQGANAMIDNVMFNGPATKPKVATYNEFFLYEPRIVDQPEEYTDVRAEVTADYQQQLETDWVKELETKYPVVINYEEIMTVK